MPRRYHDPSPDGIDAGAGRNGALSAGRRATRARAARSAPGAARPVSYTTWRRSEALDQSFSSW